MLHPPPQQIPRPNQSPMPFATVTGRSIEFRAIPGDAARHPLVFLHEGLGSAELWRDFPDKVAARLGAPALIYSRFGYGRSDGLAGPRTIRFMHEEALDVLPALLDQLGMARASARSAIPTAPRSRSSMPRRRRGPWRALP